MSRRPDRWRGGPAASPPAGPLAGPVAADPEISASRANERLRFLVSQERPPGTPHASIGALLRLADDTRAGRNVMPALIVATRAGTTAGTRAHRPPPIRLPAGRG